MAAHLALDPETKRPDVEAHMVTSGDFTLPRAFREPAKVWSQSEFKKYINKTTSKVTIQLICSPKRPSV